MGIPAQQAAKITRPLMPSAAPAVLLHSLHTQQGVCNIVIAMTRRDFGKPAFSLRKKRFVKTHALSLLGTTRLLSRSAGSGLAVITPTAVTNATVNAAAFTPGTTAPVNITVSQINPILSSLAQISVSDQAGNVTACDPVSIVVVPTKPGKHHKYGEHCHGGIHHDKHHVKIKHVDRGVTRIEVKVDGKMFSFKTLRDGESIDISSAYKSEKDNSITVRVYRSEGAGASVLLTK